MDLKDHQENKRKWGKYMNMRSFLVITLLNSIKETRSCKEVHAPHCFLKFEKQVLPHCFILIGLQQKCWHDDCYCGFYIKIFKIKNNKKSLVWVVKRKSLYIII